MSGTVERNGYSLSIDQDPSGQWYWNSYPTLKTPQGPYGSEGEAETAAKEWADRMPTKNWK